LNLCLIISNCDRIIKEDLDHFTDDLKRLAKETRHLRVIILTQDDLSDIKNEHKVLVKQVQMEKIERKYQVKLMHKIL